LASEACEFPCLLDRETGKKQQQQNTQETNLLGDSVFFLVGYLKRKTRTVVQCKFKISSALVVMVLSPPRSINQYNITKPSGLDSFLERWILVLCKDLMYSNEQAAAAAWLFSGVPIILAEKLRSSVSKQPQFMMMRKGCRRPISHRLVVVIPLPFCNGMTW
jgi:hypothetical protein